MQVKEAWKTFVATTPEQVVSLVDETYRFEGCLILTYVNTCGEVTTRGSWITTPVQVSQAGNQYFKGRDSLRDEVISYRVDAVIDAHRLEA